MLHPSLDRDCQTLCDVGERFQICGGTSTYSIYEQSRNTSWFVNLFHNSKYFIVTI